MRRTVIALVATLALTACGGGDDGGAGKTATAPTGPTIGATGATPAGATGVTALDGTWSSGEISVDDVAETLEAEGFGERELEVFLDEMGIEETFELTWKVGAGQYTLEGVADGGVEIGRIDAADVAIEGDTVTFAYFSGGSSTLRWTIEGDRLELQLIEDVQPDIRGIPTAVWVASLYTTKPWERVAL